MFNRRLLPALIGLALLVGCSPEEGLESTGGSGNKKLAINVSGIARDYKKFRLITPEPVYVDPLLAILCRGASKNEVEASRETKGPHANAAVKIFMNDLAADAFLKGSTAYPVGAIIVKEKQLLGYRTGPGETEGRGEGVGGMVKREPGYDPDNGDWEYFYFDTPENIESGRMANCIECHQRAKHTDYVFGHWHRLVKE